MKQTDIQVGSDHSITAQVYEADHDAVLIIASATGVKQGFYKKFASFISSHGITVVTFDYSGIGLSKKQPLRRMKTNASDWGQMDLDAVIRFAKVKYPTSKITLLGHSIGGQLIGLAKSSLEVQKIVLVSAQSGYWKFWKGGDKLKMWFNWHVLFPILIQTFGYLPSKRMSGMEDLPQGVARQWSRWSRKPNYLFDDMLADEVYFHQISVNLTAISIERDFYAPKEAVDWLTGKYENAAVKKLHLMADKYGTSKIGHFGIFRDKFENSLWTLLLIEMER